MTTLRVGSEPAQPSQGTPGPGIQTPKAYLTAISGQCSGQAHIVRIGQRFVFGRGQDVSIRVESPWVSREHAAVELTPEGLFVTDLGSRNGTYLHNERLKAGKSVRAYLQDTLTLGESEFMVLVMGLEEEQERTRQILPLLPSDEFKILGKIGDGAAGRVYAADQELLRRRVAIKVLRGDAGEEWQARFLIEGRLASRIRSPNVVRVYDVRRVGNKHYIIMELVNGPSVKDRLREGPMDIPEAIKIAEDIACGLAAVHQADVIHRDVKPGNMILSPDGLSKLSDFGIAKDLLNLRRDHLTKAGEGLGTLAFISPEQVLEAKHVDHRTDLYGLGASLFTMICGRPPFFGPQVLRQVLLATPPRMQQLREDCPAEVAAYIKRMIAKVPYQRPAKASIAAEDLCRLRERHYPDYVHRGLKRTDAFEITHQE